MQQTGFNLIAIGIFAMTLLSLLSPLLKFSPTIPAIATFSILGLLTLDTFSFKGRGGTLFLDLIKRGSKEYRDRILHHEAGHFLVAYILGIPIASYTLTAWEAFQQGQPGLGGVAFDADLLKKNYKPVELQLFFDRFCTVLMAGIAAETVVYGSAEGGVDDREKLKEALVLFGRAAAESSQKERFGLMQSTSLIEKHKNSYEALVKAMEERASVPDCYRIIQRNLA